MAKVIMWAALVLAFPLLALVSTPGVASSQAGNGKYDTDGDRLIEVSNLEQLDAIRYDLDGDGSADRDGDANKYAGAFPTSGEETVCNTCDGYELTRSLDFDDPASYASGSINTAWTTGTGWDPIMGGFDATFDGGGNTINNLYISRADTYNVGLFAWNGFDGVIRNIGLADVNVSGQSGGGLAGANQGTISQSYTTGRVEGSGGLVGRNGLPIGMQYSAMISRSHSSAEVSGRNVGGLAGENFGTIVFSHATGNVSADADGDGGGLVGRNYQGTIRASYATGNVSASGHSHVGGLAGRNHYGTIRDSYATGNVSGGDPVGGLAGDNRAGRIISSYATGNVKGEGEGNDVGGLVGQVYSDEGESWIISSYATGDVSGGSSARSLAGGGLAGSVYTRADVQVVHNVKVVASYATGKVSGTGSVGGLFGYREDARRGASRITVTASYWDTQASGQTSGVGSGNSTGVQGRTTAQLQSPTGYTGIYSAWNSDLDNADGDNNAATGADDFWDFGTSGQYPALKADLDGDGTPTWEEFGHQRGDLPTFTVPEAPAGLTATAQGPTEINFSWSAPSDNGGDTITSYDLRHIETAATDKSDANWTLMAGVWSVGSGPLQYVLTGLLGDTQYDLQVRAVNAAGMGQWSETVSGTTDPPVVPGAPTGLNALVVMGVARVVLSWDAPASDGGAVITGYKIEASDDGADPWTAVITTSGDGTTYTDQGDDTNGPVFAAGTSRYYRVLAINSVGEGPPSELAFAEDLVARYDANDNGVIDRSEVIRAINDYLAGAEGITRAGVIRLINLYLSG